MATTPHAKTAEDEYKQTEEERRQAIKQAKLALRQAYYNGEADKIAKAKDTLNSLQSSRFTSSVANVTNAFNTLHEKGKNDSNLKDAKEKILSPAFYRDLFGGVSKAQGNEADAKAQKAEAMANNYKRTAAIEGQEAQQHQQQANRNEYTEAGKTASMQNDAQNRQKIANTEFSAGTASARLRQTTTPDVMAQREIQNQQLSEADAKRKEQLNDLGKSDMSAADAEQQRIASRDFNYDFNKANNMSVTGNTSGNTADQPGDQPTGTTDTGTTDTGTTDTGTTDTGTTDTEAKVKAEKMLKNIIDAQNAINIYDNVDTRWYPYIDSNGEVKLISTDNTGGSLEAYKNTTDKNGNKLNLEDRAKGLAETMSYDSLVNLRDSTVQANGIQSGWFNNLATVNRIVGPLLEPIISDKRFKNILGNSSKDRMSFIKCLLETGHQLSPDEFEYIAAHQGGKFKHSDKEYDFFKDDDWKDDIDGSVLDGYADFIRNYVYTYKPEATSIDPSINPNEEHIGPMAQDIEKVNPACIKETPDGVKEVDTGRLALMNAGAIADLARELKALKEVFS